ncbi:MAG: type II toxin-antitoxin system RelE/ParE family toxin [Methyloprofundus sp.]|nr:type II toxin-antitoxin system RelE/ParE family toxin [Methyloprofundus sp.]
MKTEWKVNLYPGVEKDILRMPDQLQSRMLKLLDLIAVKGASLGEPQSKALGKGMFELRAKSSEGIARGLYCFQMGKNVFILHAFVKKTQKLPKQELDLALKRKKEIENAHDDIR